jgi:mannosyltransferase
MGGAVHVQVLVADAPVTRTAPTSPAPSRSRPRRRLRLRYLGPEAAVGTFTGLVFTWRVDVPSPWRDEAATMVLADRSLSDILQVTQNIDVVHLAYYVIAHTVMRLFPGPTLDAEVTAVRMISVIAAALTAVVLVRIGRQLDSLAVGVLAGILYSLEPFVTRYAQEARSYALVALIATSATYALLRACRRPWRRRRWLLYAALMVLGPVFNLLSLLLVLVHAVYVGVTASGAIRRNWAIAIAGAMTVLAPFVSVAFSQRGQVDWITAPSLDNLQAFLEIQFHSSAIPLAFLVIGVVALWLGPRIGLSSLPNRNAFVLGLTWVLLPPLVLWTVSQFDPLFDWRYMVFSLPGGALMLASMATFVRPYGIVVPLLAVIVAGYPMQLMYRDAEVGHSEDIRGATAYLQAEAQAGDAILFVPWYMRILEQMYPERFSELEDLAIGEGPVESQTIFGMERPAAEMSQALPTHRRVWLITGLDGMSETMSQGDDEKVELLLGDYSIAKHVTFDRFQVFLYIRSANTPAGFTPKVISPSQPF